jgi:hypothetical protein
MLDSPRRPSRTTRIFVFIRIAFAGRPADVLHKALGREVDACITDSIKDDLLPSMPSSKSEQIKAHSTGFLASCLWLCFGVRSR